MPNFEATPPELLRVLAEPREREPISHRPDTAIGMEDFDSLMAPGYWEVGASGRRYDREFILAHLSSHPPEDAAVVGWQTSGFACRRLGPESYLLTYTLDQNGRKTRRSTLWERFAGAWRILYHQGTVIASEGDNTAPPGTGNRLPEIP